MNKKYFDTKKDSLEDKINTIASEKVAFSKPVSDVKLSVEKKYFESKQGSLEEIASKVVSESFIKENTYAFDYNFELYMPSTSQRGDGDAIKEYEGTIKASGKDAAEAKPKAEKELQKRIDAAEKATRGTLEGENLGSGRAVSEGMDPVNKDAVKKKFDDRKDKDIDNDGDTDSSDKFLHKRRKAISKAMKKEHHEKDADGKVIEHEVEETTPSSVEEGKKGLWDNIHAKRKRGEKPAKKGDKDYPKTLNVEGDMKTARKNVGASTCWDGYKAKGTKKKGGKTVPNCVKEFSEWRALAEKK